MAHEELVETLKETYVSPLLNTIAGDEEQLRVAVVMYCVAQMLGDGYEPHFVASHLMVAADPVSTKTLQGPMTHLVPTVVKQIMHHVTRRVMGLPKGDQETVTASLYHAIAEATSAFTLEHHRKAIKMERGHVILAKDAPSYGH
jgi:hypothetical protein